MMEDMYEKMKLKIVFLGIFGKYANWKHTHRGKSISMTTRCRKMQFPSFKMMGECFMKSHHDPGGRAQVQLDDEAVPPGQKGSPGGGLQHTGVGAG